MMFNRLPNVTDVLSMPSVGFGATVRKLFNFGVRCTTNDVRCFMVFSATSRL